MTLFRVGDTSVECGILTPVLLLVLILTDMLPAVLLTAVALTLHELAHVLTAKKLGAAIYAIELQPFGFVARLGGHSPDDETAIALAGPLFSLISGICALCVCNYVSVSEGIMSFAAINLALGLINLLPALPLDGGRVLRAILSKLISERAGVLVSAWAGVIVAVMLSALGVLLLMRGEINATLFVMSVFLFVGAIREFGQTGYARIGALVKRRDMLLHGNAVRVHRLAVHKSVHSGRALKLLRADCYNVVVVVDDDMTALGELTEGALVRYTQRAGAFSAIGDAVP